jgi:hypothetical protein
LSARHVTAAVWAIVPALAMATPALADEGGASMYLSGGYASMAAVPNAPGWSYALIYYHATGAIGDTAFESTNVAYGALTYAFATPVLGAQLALTMVGASGGIRASVGGVEDSRFGFNDLLPTAALRWNSGVNNYMTYVQLNVPTGTYDSTHLANFGLGHGAIDGGAGYTYFDPKTGWEFSAVAGLTANFANQNTNYLNGMDAHIDWGASKFLTDQLQAGFVGYFYQQLTADQGQPPLLGDFRSSVVAVGPQIGYLFTIGGKQGYVNFKGYREFAAENRPGGWNVWLTFSIANKAP